MIFNIPTWISLLRIMLIPFFLISFYYPCLYKNLISAVIFITASITDLIDGFLARKLKQTTHFGAFIDPVADKIIIVISLILIIEYFHVWWITIPGVIIITREIIISALREWMAKINKSTKISVSWIGKIKTTIQMLAIFSLLWRPNSIIEFLGIIFLYISLFFTCWSMLNYFYFSMNNFFKN